MGLISGPASGAPLNCSCPALRRQGGRQGRARARCRADSLGPGGPSAEPHAHLAAEVLSGRGRTVGRKRTRAVLGARLPEGPLHGAGRPPPAPRGPAGSPRTRRGALAAPHTHRPFPRDLPAASARSLERLRSSGPAGGEGRGAVPRVRADAEGAGGAARWNLRSPSGPLADPGQKRFGGLCSSSPPVA